MNKMVQSWTTRHRQTMRQKHCVRLRAHATNQTQICNLQSVFDITKEQVPKRKNFSGQRSDNTKQNHEIYSLFKKIKG